MDFTKTGLCSRLISIRSKKNYRVFRSLNVYLLSTIVLFSTSITLVVTSIQLYFEYNKNLSQIESTFEQVKNSYLSSIESSLWSLNRPQLQSIIEGILKLQDLRYVRVETKEHGTYAEAGIRDSNYVISRVFPVKFRYNNIDRPIGEIHLYASLSGVYERLISLCLIILISNAIKTFLVSFFILVLVRKVVTNHLEKIHSFFLRFDPTKSLTVPEIQNQKFDNEMSILVDSINRMRESIKEKMTIIENHSEELEKKVNSQTFALDRSNIEKTNLLRTLSHDIMNPLAIVKAKSHRALTKGSKDNVFRKDDWEKVKKAASSMESIIEMVRQLDATNSGKVELQLQPVTLWQVFRNSEFIFEDKLQSKNIRLIYTSDEDSKQIQVLAEPVSLSNQVVNNLISNAIKFSYNDSLIYFSVSESDQYVCLQIQDSGPGIPPDIKDNLFNPHYKTSRAGTAGESGTGFGMLLVKNYVEKYGGKIATHSTWIEENPENHGTKFSIYLKRYKGVKAA